ncbi:hypothetical protein EF384_04330 [Aerococcus agrisoli]|uniref:Polysaccharide biosynthesis protein n=1 Tax=Aerococcus agrisoli TaxID=2487350 RepID=A0A3N4GFM2_9LACT|nr:oligosaccharide flippase family protein [Aerococcus agrisoli]RPA60678.1 hypothetical protein EF384_04330 [Aerococcus agrisoli]
MNTKIFKNILTVISSNFLLLVLGLVMSFIIPLITSVENYAYWQLYLYYSGFVGFFMLGFNDGINIRYAGNNIDNLPKNLFNLFFRVVITMGVVSAIICIAILLILPLEFNQKVTLLFVTINIIIFNIHGFCIHINQMTMRFKYYSIANIVEKLLFVISIPIFFVLDSSYYWIILLNLFCRILAMSYNLWTVRNLIFNTGESLKVKDNIDEIKENYKAGLPLMLASIFAMFMTTVPKIVVQNHFEIVEYGYFSFGYSTLNIAIQLISAMSVVFYPSLKNLDTNSYGKVYKEVKFGFLIISLFLLLIYYPINLIVSLVFTKYINVLQYLFLLFPIVIFQSFNSLITANFSRLKRLEKKYLYNNAFFLILNLSVTNTVAFFVHDIRVILVVSLICMTMWAFSGENYVEKSLGLGQKESKFIVPLLIFSIIIFILINYSFSLFSSLAMYLLYIFVIILIFRKHIKVMISRFINKK